MERCGNWKSTKSERCREPSRRSYTIFLVSRCYGCIAAWRGDARPLFTAKRVPRPPCATQHDRLCRPVPAKNSDRPLKPYAIPAETRTPLGCSHAPRRRHDSSVFTRFKEDRRARWRRNPTPIRAGPDRERAFRRCPRGFGSLDRRRRRRPWQSDVTPPNV